MTFVREHRFLVEPDRAAAFMDAIAPHVSPELYDRERPVAFTRTTYLDTDTYSYARSSSRGLTERLRVREYAAAKEGCPPTLTGLCFLEYKRTRGRTRIKMRLSGAPEHIAALIDSHGADSAPFARNATLHELTRRLASPDVRPRVATPYRRESLVVTGQPVRITVDHRVTFIETSPIGHAGDLVTANAELGTVGKRVLEVKYAGIPAAWLRSAMKGLHETKTFSKFAWAMAAIRQRPCKRAASSR